MLAVAVALALALVYIAVTPPRYTAVATLLVDPRQEQVTDATSVLPGIGTDSAAIASQVNVLESRGLLERVFTAENLAADNEFSQPGMLSKLLATIRGTTTAVSPAASFDEFRRRVNVQRLGLTYVLEVHFTSQDPAKAAKIANAVVEEYLLSLARDKSDANLGVTQQLEHRIDALRNELAEAELATERFKEDHNILAAGGGATVLQSQIDQLTAQISVAREQAREALNRSEQARSVLASSNGISDLDDLLTSEVGAQLRAQHNGLTAAAARMRSNMGPRHPSLVAAEAEVSGLERLMRQEAGRTMAQLEADARLAEDNVQGAEAQLAELGDRMVTVNRDEVALRQLERNADVARNLLEEFMRRARETGELGAMQSSDAKVLSAAAEPRSATWPKVNLMVALAAAGGLALGCTIALVLGEPSPALPTGSDPTGSPSASKRRHVSSLTQAGHAWRNLGTQSTRLRAQAATARIEAFLDGERKGKDKLFAAAISTLSSEQKRSELLYSLARSYASAGVSTLVLDLDPCGPVLYRQQAAAMEPLTSFASNRPPALPSAARSPFVVLDDRIDNQPLTAALLNALENWAAEHGFELMLINMPRHFSRLWSDAAQDRLDAEVLIVRSEDFLADRVGALASDYHGQSHPVAFLSLRAAPALVDANVDAPRPSRSEAVR